jgi:hypothetical protein
MCTADEIYYSVAKGVISASGGAIAKAWVYFPNWQQPAGTPTQEPTAGLADNCSGYTYQTADTHTTGVAFAFAQWTYNTNYVPKFFGGSADAACNQHYPIACCK